MIHNRTVAPELELVQVYPTKFRVEEDSTHLSHAKVHRNWLKLKKNYDNL